MGHIRRLPQKIANQIAAGEVVERPASAVKELLENSIDAGASRISVEIEEGGKELIRVTDNGCGMSREDVELSVEPHATSKIYDEKGLSEIRTLGFRGEALASLGAVSELTVASRTKGSDTGWKTRVAFGKTAGTYAVGMAEGTVVTVENLFLEIPARRKFLKRRQTEQSHIAMKVRTAAVIYPDTEFRLVAGGKTLFRSRKGVSGPDILWPLIGNDLASRLLSFSGGEMDASVKGFISRPSDAMSNPRAFYFFLNGRPIADRLLWKAVTEAGRGFFMKGRYPAGAMFIDISPELVDVNVHPAKHEVRFHDSNRIFRLAYHAVKRALEKPEVHAINRKSPGKTATCDTAIDTYPAPGHAPDCSVEQRTTVQQPLPTGNNEKKVSEPMPLPWEEKQTPGIKKGRDDEQINLLCVQDARPGGQVCPSSQPAGTAGHKPRFSAMDVKGQFASTYIIAEHEGSLFLVDQHAAHEAILFKRLMDEFRESGVAISQPLLFPEVIERSPDFLDRFDAAREVLERIGISAERFGESEIVIKALPSFLAETGNGAEKAVGIMERLVDCPDQEIDSAIHDILASFACGLAIKAGQRLATEEIKALLEEIDTEGRYHCPHGRPIMRRFTLTELEKMFGRIN
jgi:DNA mismatch repair protein MutL